jgi:Tol biopolymer transport system component
MELVEGETLADIVKRGPVPLDTALGYARQIADALEAAHEKGIVHRDLKPANVKVTPEGRVKVLDFGLAAVVQGPATASASDLTASPTLTMRATQVGMVIGTAAYMAPEQARGKQVDKRADIWAFGVVLYELLAGKPAFDGEDVTEILASVVKEKPDLTTLPAQVRPLIECCLAKDPRNRLRDLGDMELLLAAPAPPAAARPQRNWTWIAAALVLVVAFGTVSLVHFRETPPQPVQVRFQVPPPEGGAFRQVLMALSPDGRQLAFLASGKGGGPAQLWVRALDSLEARPLAGTEGALSPSWSPDGRFVVFATTDGKLIKVSTAGGPAQTLGRLSPSPYAFASHWTKDGFIFVGGTDGLYRLPQAGGDPVRVTQADAAHGELANAYPHILPDGLHYLYLAAIPSDKSAIYLASWDGRLKKRLIATSRGFRYAPPSEPGGMGHLLFVREETLMAQPFDAKTLSLAGEAFPVVEHVGLSGSTYAEFTTSENGALAYYPRTRNFAGNTQLTWFDRSGKVVGNLGPPGNYNNVALTRDGSRAAVLQRDQSHWNIWVIDVARGIPTRFTFSAATDLDPVWSPDGSQLAYMSGEGGGALAIKSFSGGGNEERLTKGDSFARPCDWSPDGRSLMYVHAQSITGQHPSLWLLSDMAGDPANRKTAPYLEPQFSIGQCQFSPDGRWLAYTSNEAAQGNEVYVQSYPAGTDKTRISNGGGSQPRWRRDGKELFYMGVGGRVVALDVKTGPKFQAGIPHQLFETHMFLPEAGTRANDTTTLMFRYDVTPDGKRFLVNNTVQAAPAEVSPPITWVLNWTAGLKK